MALRRITDFERVLVVEGYSDLLFFAEVLEHLECADRVFIQQFNGKSDLVEKLETFRACMAEAGFQAQSPAKGLVGSLLAIRNDEDPRLGPGARRGVFDLGQPGFDALRVFLAEFKP